MLWVAPSEKDTATNTLEQRLWEAADQLRANSGLPSAPYSTPVLGLIFLRFTDVRFAKVRAGLEKIATSSRRGSRVDEPAARQTELSRQNFYQACSPLLSRQVNLEGDSG
ncbi:MAG: hypothetical protein CV089_21000 [Nitrospira sp. WS110]|nr:hypothetical protein [Nitrospira sp. WS110]